MATKPDPDRRAKWWAQHYEKNREKYIAKARTRRLANPDEAKEYAAEYRKANRARLQESNRAWLKLNADRKAATDKAWRNANPDRVAEYHQAELRRRKEKRAEWRKSHPRVLVTQQQKKEKARIRNARYRAKHREQIAESYKARLLLPENKAKALARSKRWREKNREYFNRLCSITAKKNREIISSGYARTLLQRRGFDRADISADLEGVVSEMVKLKREIKKCLSTI